MTCCIIPLVLFSLGVGGAWIGRQAALAPNQPYFIAVPLGFLGYGYWLVYRRPKVDPDGGDVRARPLPSTVLNSALWISTALAALMFAWPWIVPVRRGFPPPSPLPAKAPRWP